MAGCLLNSLYPKWFCYIPRHTPHAPRSNEALKQTVSLRSSSSFKFHHRSFNVIFSSQFPQRDHSFNLIVSGLSGIKGLGIIGRDTSLKNLLHTICILKTPITHHMSWITRILKEHWENFNIQRQPNCLVRLNRVQNRMECSKELLHWRGKGL